MSTGSPKNICDANKNSFQMHGIIKLHALLCSKSATIKLIIRKTMATPTIIGADFCNQYVMPIRPKRKLMEPDIDGCIPIVRKPRERTRLRTMQTDGHVYLKDSSSPPPLVRVAEKVILPLHAQTKVTVQTAHASNAALLLYTCSTTRNLL